MSFQPNPQNRTEWTSYATIMLLAIVVTALGTALQVPQSITQWLRSIRMPVPAVQKADSALPEASRIQFSQQEAICGGWQSQTSQKKYQFVCKSNGYFEVYELTESGLIKIGSGSATHDGTVEADLVSIAKNRRGHWKLTLSSDGRMMHGPWYGDDPRESGQLTFYKVA